MNDARYPNISAIDNGLAELENEKQQLLALREALPKLPKKPKG
tara:strand:+ start:1076 stop:1204 length:129 start_codon:yes stop_codon:yes gene_type:complete